MGLWVLCLCIYIARSVNELCARTMSKERLLMFVCGCHKFSGVPYCIFTLRNKWPTPFPEQQNAANKNCFTLFDDTPLRKHKTQSKNNHLLCVCFTHLFVAHQFGAAIMLLCARVQFYRRHHIIKQFRDPPRPSRRHTTTLFDLLWRNICVRSSEPQAHAQFCILEY